MTYSSRLHECNEYKSGFLYELIAKFSVLKILSGTLAQYYICYCIFRKM